MSGATTELGLAIAVDADDNADYLTIGLANALRTLDALLNNATGHTHNGAHQGGPIGAIPAGSIPDGSITSAKIADGGIATVDLADLAVTNAKLGYDVSRRNLLPNGGLEIWQRGNGPYTAANAFCADRWQVGLAGGDTLSVTADSVNVDTVSGSQRAAACAYTRSSGLSSIYNTLYTSDGQQIRGRTFSASVRVKCSVPNMVRLAVATNGAAPANGASTYHTGDGTWQTLRCTMTSPVPADATYVSLNVQFNANGTAYVDNVVLVPGQVAPDFYPLLPGEDLAICQRYYEVHGFEASNWPNIAGQATVAAQNFFAPFTYHVRKGGIPTVTKVGTWGALNCAQPSVQRNGTSGYTLNVVATASGVLEATAPANGGITAEWNPA